MMRTIQLLQVAVQTTTKDRVRVEVRVSLVGMVLDKPLRSTRVVVI